MMRALRSNIIGQNKSIYNINGLGTYLIAQNW